MFGERIVLLLLLLGLSAAFAPPKYRSNRRTTCKASADGENGDTSASTIHIALVGSDADELGLESMLSEHPFCQMTKIKLSLETVPVTSSWDDDVVSSLQAADIACFETSSCVKTYLQRLDEHLAVPDDISDEDRRGLSNRPDPADGADESGQQSALMAACRNTSSAKECLNSGRWESNHIYYPKDSGRAVELKTQAIGEEDEPSEDEEEEVDVQVWVDSIVQAAGKGRNSWFRGPSDEFHEFTTKQLCLQGMFMKDHFGEVVGNLATEFLAEYFRVDRL